MTLDEFSSALAELVAAATEGGLDIDEIQTGLEVAIEALGFDPQDDVEDAD